METTFKGDVAELMAASELVERGYIVSRPLTNGAAYDLLVDLDGRILRIQVKRSCRQSNGTLRINLYTSKYHRGRSRIGYDGKVDFILGVDCDNREFYLIGGDQLKRTAIHLRATPSLNNQVVGCRPATEFLLDRVFPKRLVGAAGFEPAASAV